MSYFSMEVRNPLEPGASSQCAEIFNVLHCQMFLIRKKQAWVLSFLNKCLALRALLCLCHTNIYTHFSVVLSHHTSSTNLKINTERNIIATNWFAVAGCWLRELNTRGHLPTQHSVLSVCVNRQIQASKL